MSKKPIKLPYDIPWILQRCRAFLLGREHRSALRWAKDLAPKTQPQPDLPLGPSSKIRFNYYCDRDPRGEVMRPRVLYEAEVRKRMLSECKRAEAAGFMLEGVTVGLEEAERKTEEGKEKNEKVKGFDETKDEGIPTENRERNLGRVKEKDRNAVRRVPGKVWHWDTLDGDPTKKCCGK
ncbi:uncharacterized protein LOC129001960 [Macrosteles quadrilineatus]|uniref:uncharacterized protein LOC129001960 n=1 Tax=Macrosteles quadrilineatus TaxID=74068 RepID=UPI0023E0CB0C|nr:uncharacterized protein LOC129001960 [Macrosteles quadrilineatus]